MLHFYFGNPGTLIGYFTQSVIDFLLDLLLINVDVVESESGYLLLRSSLPFNFDA